MNAEIAKDFLPIMEQLMRDTVKTAIDSALTELKNTESFGKKNNKKSTYQKTESLLYNYNNFKASIKDMKELLKDIKNSDYEKQSKSFVKFNTGYDFLPDSEFERIEEKVAHIEKSIKYISRYVHSIDDVLKFLKDDRYIDIIRLKYFENLSSEEIAERLFVDLSTINRNRKRLVDAIKVRIFSMESINEIIFE